MEDRIKKQFNDKILKEVISRFDLDYDKTRLLDGFENFMFYSKRSSQKCVLRISHTIRRTKGQILSELEFLRYLNENKLNVPLVFESKKNNLVEEVESENGIFLACLFEFVDGIKLAENLLNDNFISKMGEFLGQLHHLSVGYNPKVIGRPDFFEETMPLFDFIPEEDDKIIRSANDAIDKVREIPKNDKNYGLAHVDFHFGNCLIREGEIVLFDFDDCQYSWFVHDISMSFFYYLPHNDRSKAVIENGHNFLRRYITGYRGKYEIEEDLLPYIQDFLKIREIELYSLIHRSFDVNNLQGWEKSFMQHRKEKLENKQPYFEIDVEKVYA